MKDSPLALLSRTDKWYLSCGDGVLWAPPFPKWLHRPGFWDEAHVFHRAVDPIFTMALVRPSGAEVPLTRVAARWRPDRWVREWRTDGGCELRETAYALPGGRLVSSWSAPGGWPDDLVDCTLVAFTAQPGEAVADVRPTHDGGGIQWGRAAPDVKGRPGRVQVTLSTPAAARATALRSEGTPYPEWTHTPFWERWPDSDHPVSVEGPPTSGLVYAAVAARLDSSDDVRFVARLWPSEARPPAAGDTANPERAWAAFFDAFPAFSCSDSYLERYYAYRIFGLRLNRLDGGVGHLGHPAVAEGIGYFHVPISYSTPVQMLETRWMHTPELAQGALLNFIETQRDDGSFHGRIYPDRLEGTDFYHGNWGDALDGVDVLHADEAFLARAYDGLARYGDWLARTRDSGSTGMYDVVNHYETGQEYMSRYQVVDPDADRAGWQSRMRLKGIDVTVYAYRLSRALQGAAARLGRDADAERWRNRADGTARAITDEMWDDEAGMYTDIDPGRRCRTGVKAAVGFYPLLTDIPDAPTVDRLLDRLRNPEEFGTPFPVPSSSADDPAFAAEPIWKGRRHNCPWNGRVWPMANSHVVGGLLRQWRAGRREVGPVAVHLLQRFIRMMFHDGDLGRPNCYEHYNPITGRPSVYRGIDDYQHSWILDLLIRGVAGLHPTAAGITVDPLPFDVDHVRLEDARVRRRRVTIERNGTNLTVLVDGERSTGSVGTPLEVPFA